MAGWRAIADRINQRKVCFPACHLAGLLPPACHRRLAKAIAGRSSLPESEGFRQVEINTLNLNLESLIYVLKF